jgi:hypothetical protein
MISGTMNMIPPDGAPDDPWTEVLKAGLLAG